MLFPIGLIVLFGSVIGGYLMHHGKLSVLWQPNELVIIGGAALGAFMISNPGSVIKSVGKSFGKLFKGSPYKKSDYLELLVCLFGIFKLIKTKGMLEIEQHIEKPEESDLFKKYPSVVHNHHAVVFLCDYLRLMSMGTDNPYHIDDLMEKECDVHHHDLETSASAVNAVADAMPALGIVAAVLGVITTMGSITEPPPVLGGLIGAALVGTFLGVLVAYGILGPIASFLGKFGHAEGVYYSCIRQAIVTHLHGNAPTVTIEFTRKLIPHHLQPGFKEVEEAISKGGA